MKVVRDDGKKFEAHCFGGDYLSLKEWLAEHIPTKTVEDFIKSAEDKYPPGWKTEQLLPFWIILEGESIRIQMKELPRRYKIL